MLTDLRRLLNAHERSHRGSTPIFCAYDGWWRLRRDFNELFSDVCKMCSCFDRVTSQSVMGLSDSEQKCTLQRISEYAGDEHSKVLPGTELSSSQNGKTWG